MGGASKVWLEWRPPMFAMLDVGERLNGGIDQPQLPSLACKVTSRVQNGPFNPPALSWPFFWAIKLMRVVPSLQYPKQKQQHVAVWCRDRERSKDECGGEKIRKVRSKMGAVTAACGLWASSRFSVARLLVSSLYDGGGSAQCSGGAQSDYCRLCRDTDHRVHRVCGQPLLGHAPCSPSSSVSKSESP